MRYQDMPEDERALTFPCQFPVKAMGLAQDGIKAILLEILQQNRTAYAPETIAERHSSNGKYVGVTVVITATSRAELDGIYQALAACPQILTNL